MPDSTQTKPPSERAKNEHGYCPNCGKDFDGELIWHYFYNRLITDGYYHNADPLPPDEAEAKADEIASNYGATRTKGRWGHVIGIYDQVKDRRVALACPECKHQWPI